MKVYIVKVETWFDWGYDYDYYDETGDVVKVLSNKEDAITFINNVIDTARPKIENWLVRLESNVPDPRGDIFEARKLWYIDESDITEEEDYIGEYAQQYICAWVEEWEVE